MRSSELGLPDYFLADVPRGCLTPTLIREGCQALKRNRARELADRSVGSLIDVLCEAAHAWLKPTFRLRQLALTHAVATTGFPATTVAAGLDAFFAEFTRKNFEALLVQDFGHSERLESFVASPVEEGMQRHSLVTGPEFLAHIGAGNLPCPALMSLVTGVLLRSAQLLKCATGTSFLPRLFAHSLHELEPKLAACLEIAEWPGGTLDLEEALFACADCVTVTGGDEAVRQVRARVPPRVRVLTYGERLSFAYVTREALLGAGLGEVVARVVDDIVAWNQLGCLSPHAVYVEHRAAVAPEAFAERLAEGLAEREHREPRGGLSPQEAAAITTRRHFHQVRAACGAGTRVWCSPDSTAWTVVSEVDPSFYPSCLNRFIYVKSVSAPEELLPQVDAVSGRVSTVGLAASGRRGREIAHLLARWGVPRICPLGRMQKPPLLWRHDGRPMLGELVTWTDWET
jgi:hypothetical protein